MKNVITNIFDLPVKISILGALTSFTIKDMSEAGGLIVLCITVIYMILKVIDQTRQNQINKLKLRELKEKFKDENTE